MSIQKLLIHMDSHYNRLHCLEWQCVTVIVFLGGGGGENSN